MEILCKKTLFIRSDISTFPATSRMELVLSYVKFSAEIFIFLSISIPTPFLALSKFPLFKISISDASNLNSSA